MVDIETNLTVIIRSVGERTEQICHQLIKAQCIPEENIVIVNEMPFSAALRKSYQIGLERCLPWTLCVDADVLLRPLSVKTLQKYAAEQGGNVFEIQGFVLDKFFGGPRHGGPHLYRSALFEKALSLMPTGGEDIRPEGSTLEKMKANGFPYVVVPYLTGIHDFEQYYRDIYRKCFVQAHKHLEYADLFVEIWRAGAEHDYDFQVALNGFANGIRLKDDVSIDASLNVFEFWSENPAIQEKEPLEKPEDFTPEIIEEIITHWKEPLAYQNKFPSKAGLIQDGDGEHHTGNLLNKFKLRYEGIGLIRMIPYTIGWLLTKISEWLIAFADE
jgi:hypothetical protein